MLIFTSLVIFLHSTEEEQIVVIQLNYQTGIEIKDRELRKTADVKLRWTAAQGAEVANEKRKKTANVSTHVIIMQLLHSPYIE